MKQLAIFISEVASPWSWETGCNGKLCLAELQLSGHCVLQFFDREGSFIVSPTEVHPITQTRRVKAGVKEQQ